MPKVADEIGKRVPIALIGARLPAGGRALLPPVFDKPRQGMGRCRNNSGLSRLPRCQQVFRTQNEGRLPLFVRQRTEPRRLVIRVKHTIRLALEGEASFLKRGADCLRHFGQAQDIIIEAVITQDKFCLAVATVVHRLPEKVLQGALPGTPGAAAVSGNG